MDHVATNAYRAITTIPIVCRATVPQWAAFQRFVMHPVNVRVWQVLLESNVHNAAPVTMHIPNVYVSVVTDSDGGSKIAL